MNNTSNDKEMNTDSERKAIGSFEKLMAELTEQETQKVLKMNRKQIAEHCAATRVHLIHSYSLLTSAATVMETIYAQYSVVVETLKGLVGEAALTDLLVNSQDNSKVIEQIKKMAAKNVC